MSEMSARELIDRITALDMEEQIIAIRNLPAQLMFDELINRYNEMEDKLKKVARDI